MAEPVDEKTCEARHNELVRRFDVDNKRLNAHSEGLGDMKEVIVRLVTVQEISTQTMKDQQTAMKDHSTAVALIDKRVNKLEEQRIALTEVHMTELDDQVLPFWSTTGGQWIIRGGVGIAVILTFAAIGQSVNPELLAELFGK